MRPQLSCCGIEDDTAALQSWLSGNDVAGTLGRHLRGGSYYITRPLVVTAKMSYISSCRFTLAHSGALFVKDDTTSVRLTDVDVQRDIGFEGPAISFREQTV
jgi:hypothetical protein